MARLIEDADLAEYVPPRSREQRWRQIQAGLFPKKPWSDELIRHFADLVAAGIDARTATEMVERRRAEQRAALLNSA
jgi:hypothetical protein